MYALNVYNGSTCDDELGNPNNLIYADNMGEHWYDEIDSWGSFEANVVLADSYPEGEDLMDADRDGDGTDDSYAEGIDTYDVAYVISHGRSTCGGSNIIEFAFPDTDASLSECWPTVNEDIEFGDGDLDIFYSAACNSAQHCVWENGGFADLDVGNFNLWGGFHGINTDGPGIPGNVTDFVSSSRWSGAGQHWLVEMTQIRSGSDNDDCATAIVWASGGSNADNYYLNAGIEDYAISTGSHTTRTYYSVGGCDPEDGFEL